LNGAVSKTVVGLTVHRGFESLPLRYKSELSAICWRFVSRVTARRRARSRQRASANASSGGGSFPRHSPRGRVAASPTTCLSHGACVGLRNRRSQVRILSGALSRRPQSRAWSGIAGGAGRTRTSRRAPPRPATSGRRCSEVAASGPKRRPECEAGRGPESTRRRDPIDPVPLAESGSP
jgi:hypothetical protein